MSSIPSITSMEKMKKVLTSLDPTGVGGWRSDFNKEGTGKGEPSMAQQSTWPLARNTQRTPNQFSTPVGWSVDDELNGCQWLSKCRSLRMGL